MPYPATTGEGRRLGLKHDYVQNQQLRWPKNYLTWAFALIETEENRLFPRCRRHEQVGEGAECREDLNESKCLPRITATGGEAKRSMRKGAFNGKCYWTGT